MTELRKQFKKEHPETIGETDRAFDDSNYIDWLEAKVKTLQQVKNNDLLHSVSKTLPTECQDPFESFGGCCFENKCEKCKK